MKILITGATGFIGKNIVANFIEARHEVHIIVRESSDISCFEKFKSDFVIHIYDGTISSMIDIFNLSKPDIVIHLAAKFVSEHTFSDIDEIMESNIVFGIHLLEGMSASECKKIITTGTNWQNYEVENYRPVNLYAATKEAFETLSQYYIDRYSISMVSLRIYDTYGPNDKRPKIMNLFEKYIDSNQTLEMSSGEQLLGMVYIEDIVGAYIVAMDRLIKIDKCSYEVFYLTPIRFYSLKEIAQCYEEIGGTKLNIAWGAKSYREREVMQPYIGSKLPDWNPKIDLEEGIQLILDKKSLK